jgi:hypothetical protein
LAEAAFLGAFFADFFVCGRAAARLAPFFFAALGADLRALFLAAPFFLLAPFLAALEAALRALLRELFFLVAMAYPGKRS